MFLLPIRACVALILPITSNNKERFVANSARCRSRKTTKEQKTTELTFIKIVGGSCDNVVTLQRMFKNFCYTVSKHYQGGKTIRSFRVN